MDLLVGGFPCQDYSVARSKSNEKGIQGKKGVLWWDIAEVLKIKKPNFVLLENVDRLLKSPANQRGRDFAIMLKTFHELGYLVQWRMINAAEYGMPQRRRRVFIFASKMNTKYSKELIKKENIKDYLLNDGFFNDIFPVQKESVLIEKKNLSIYSDAVEITNNYNQGKFLTSGICIEGKAYHFAVTEVTESLYTLEKVLNKSKKYNKNINNYVLSDEELEKWEWLRSSKRILRIKPDNTEYYYSEGKMTFPDSLDSPGRTMLTSESTANRSSHAVFDSNINAIRKITEVEAEFLQMFPPNWTKTGMTMRQRYFMMGNALVTGILSRLEHKIFLTICDEVSQV